jgi:signal peptidase I
MSITWMIFLIAALVAAGTILSVVLLRLICVIWRVPDVTWWRATRVVLVIALVNLLGCAALFGLHELQARDFLSPGLFAAAVLAIEVLAGIVVPLWAIASGLKISLAKSLGVFASLFGASAISGVLMALVFGAVVGEAFAIPTGAMAPTIVGQHVRVRCPNCGRETDVGLSHSAIELYGWEQIERRGYQCLQCGQPGVSLAEELLAGDRVFVDKTDRRPRRFDIAVFHVRREQVQGLLAQPQDMKYIKRCVGLPGEELAIVGGDLFVDGERVQKGPHEVEDLWIAAHDTSFAPRVAIGDGPQWRADTAFSGWKFNRPHWQIRSDAQPGAALFFTGPRTDLYAYELPEDADDRPRPAVRDWRITIELGEFTGDGALGFYWQHAGRGTCIGVTPRGAVQVFGDAVQFAAETDQRPDGSPARGKISRVAFAVRDGAAYLSIDGQVLATVELEPLALDEARAAAAEGEARPPEFGIVARRCKAKLRRIQLHRDVYYRTVRQVDPWSASSDEDNVWDLGDEYFFLGDQSPQSQDCRFIGPIHQREIIGIARWCYWPPARAREFPAH